MLASSVAIDNKVDFVETDAFLLDEWNASGESVEVDEIGFRHYIPIVSGRAKEGLSCELFEPCCLNIGSLSATTEKYNAMVFFHSSNKNIVVNFIKGVVNWVVYPGRETLSGTYHRIIGNIIGSSDDELTSSQLCFSGVSSNELNQEKGFADELFNDIDHLLMQLEGKEPFQRSDELEYLAEEVCQQLKEEKRDTIEDWADKLSNKISKIND